MGFTSFYISLLVFLPLAALVLKTLELDWDSFVKVVASKRAIASYQLTFGASFVAALINLVFGLLVAWVLVRYHFPGKKILDALVDLPFALPTAVAGIALTALYAPNGWIGQYFALFDIKIAYTSLGITLALVFIGLPFVVRTV